MGLVDVLDVWESFSVSQSFETSILISQSFETSIQGPNWYSQSSTLSTATLFCLPIVENVHGSGRSFRQPYTRSMRPGPNACDQARTHATGFEKRREDKNGCTELTVQPWCFWWLAKAGVPSTRTRVGAPARGLMPGSGCTPTGPRCTCW